MLFSLVALVINICKHTNLIAIIDLLLLLLLLLYGMFTTLTLKLIMMRHESLFLYFEPNTLVHSDYNKGHISSTGPEFSTYPISCHIYCSGPLLYSHHHDSTASIKEDFVIVATDIKKACN